MRENIKFLTLAKVIKMLQEDGLPASRDSLYYWEKTGKIPKFSRTPGGWRFIRLSEYEALFNAINQRELIKND